MYLVLTTRIQNINKQLHFHSRRGVHLSIVCVKSDTCYRTELKKKIVVKKQLIVPKTVVRNIYIQGLI